MKAAKPWYLYLIECVDGSIYTGITVDLDARYAAHKDGSGARYTRSHPPTRLLGFETHPDRSSASKAEHRIKQLTATQKRRFASTLVTEQPILGDSVVLINQIAPNVLPDHLGVGITEVG
ncbi:MAG TPA: GIY-YIG nuclease family protein [Azonexus sp.]|nr:GIY-YIG nuclease family protein [Azonexus sp.]